MQGDNTDPENPVPVAFDDNVNSATSSLQHHHMERRLGELDLPKRAGDSQGVGVTVFARHRLLPGTEEKFRAWVKEISELQTDKFAGYQGSQVVRPACCDFKDEYISIFRYDNYDNLQAMMNSDERRRMLEKTCAFDAQPVELTYHSLEYWFTNGDKSAGEDPALSSDHGPPPKYKMAIVTFLLIWCQVHFIVPAVDKFFPRLSPLAVESLSVLIIVASTTYLWMPLVTTYLLYWWLFPKKNKA